MGGIFDPIDKNTPSKTNMEPGKACLEMEQKQSLRIQVCPKKGITPIHSYAFLDGIGTLNPLLGRDLDP